MPQRQSYDIDMNPVIRDKPPARAPSTPARTAGPWQDPDWQGLSPEERQKRMSEFLASTGQGGSGLPPEILSSSTTNWRIPPGERQQGGDRPIGPQRPQPPAAPRPQTWYEQEQAKVDFGREFPGAVELGEKIGGAVSRKAAEYGRAFGSIGEKLAGAGQGIAGFFTGKKRGGGDPLVRK